MASRNLNVGGQAVIEGVMMRSEKFISIAVRKPDGKIGLKRYGLVPWSKRFKILKMPIFRGGIILIESLLHGIKALNWSAEVAIEEEKTEPRPNDDWKAKLSTAFTMIFGLGMGLALFFYLPLILTEWTGVTSGFAFNAVDGVIRLVIFGIYLGLISLWKEIRQIFQYHGAEHKSIFALENDSPLTLDGARGYSTLHPRCGTSFLLVVMIVSIFVFMFLGKPDTVSERLVRLLFIPLIGGISYEFIKISGKYRDNSILQVFIKPGLWLQKITTKEPTDNQLEVGLVALRSALGELLQEDHIVHYDEKNKIIENKSTPHEV